MSQTLSLLALSCCLAAAPLAAQEVGSAGGRGTIAKQTGWDAKKQEPVVEQVSFSPKRSFAYTEGTGVEKVTWIVLTEKEPPLKTWATAKDRAEARRLWCEKEKTPFVAVELNAQWGVELYFLCPGNGKINTEMLSTWNGLDSVVVKLENPDGKRLKGTLRGGEGSCPDESGEQAYCTQQDDYTFDAPLLR
jgi:hypothetical protein